MPVNISLDDITKAKIVHMNPFIVLHEFYHHIRTRAGVHRGSEKHANMYAKSFIDSYKKIVEKKMMMTMKPSSEKIMLDNTNSLIYKTDDSSK
jgi:hypothetical protein